MGDKLKLTMEILKDVTFVNASEVLIDTGLSGPINNKFCGYVIHNGQILPVYDNVELKEE